jgi:hypothetical protein
MNEPKFCQVLAAPALPVCGLGALLYQGPSVSHFILFLLKNQCQVLALDWFPAACLLAYKPLNERAPAYAVCCAAFKCFASASSRSTMCGELNYHIY